MPEISEERIRWMRNRFIEMVQRTEILSEELTRIQDELNQVVDALGGILPQSEPQPEKEE